MQLRRRKLYLRIYQMWIPYRLRHESQLNRSTIQLPTAPRKPAQNVDPLPAAPRKPAQPIYYPTIFICGGEYNISYPPQSITNIPAESTSPSSSQRAAREQSSAQTPRIERVGEYSNENTSSSPPHTENIVKRRLETNRGRVRFNTTWARDNCSPVHFIPFTNTNLRCAIT